MDKCPLFPKQAHFTSSSNWICRFTEFLVAINVNQLDLFRKIHASVGSWLTSTCMGLIKKWNSIHSLKSGLLDRMSLWSTRSALNIPGSFLKYSFRWKFIEYALRFENFLVMNHKFQHFQRVRGGVIFLVHKKSCCRSRLSHNRAGRMRVTLNVHLSRVTEETRTHDLDRSHVSNLLLN